MSELKFDEEVSGLNTSKLYGTVKNAGSLNSTERARKNKTMLILALLMFLVTGFLIYKQSKSGSIKKTYYEDLSPEVKAMIPEESVPYVPHKK